MEFNASAACALVRDDRYGTREAIALLAVCLANASAACALRRAERDAGPLLGQGYRLEMNTLAVGIYAGLEYIGRQGYMRT